jgi:4,5-dihydroxyphthalate decarboxylase
MANLKLTFACWSYDRTRALMDGSVRPEGIDLTYLSLFPAETFQRMVQFKEFEVSEMGMTYYIGTLGLEDPPFIAIPVFPVRLFVHSATFLNRASGIESPKDLAGKKVGELFLYGHDAGVWAKGILSDEYGLPVESATYYVGGLDRTTRFDWVPFGPPPNVRVNYLEPNQGLDRMLESGEIDALYSAIVPASLIRGSPSVGRLFEDYEPVEREYFRKTGIFPVIHTVVIRRDVYRQHPWVAQSLYKAFKEAKAQAENLYRFQVANMHRLFMTPWLTALQEENRRLMGDDLWPYGLEPNRKSIDTFLRYHHEQGLSIRRFTPDELFAPESLVDYPAFGR